MATRTATPDAEIEFNVRDTLYSDCRIISDNIEVHVANGKLYLRGTVPDDGQRALARAVAERIKGVREVINLLDISPIETRTDADITADVVSALTTDTMVDEDKIEVTTVDGVVYLRGTVDSYNERKAAHEDAREVRGVVDVINELAVVSNYAHDDEQIAENILRQLRENLRLNSSKVEVKVKYGVVHLDGTVASIEQRWLVDELVRWTPGVIDVVNDLGVVKLPVRQRQHL